MEYVLTIVNFLRLMRQLQLHTALLDAHFPSVRNYIALLLCFSARALA